MADKEMDLADGSPIGCPTRSSHAGHGHFSWMIDDEAAEVVGATATGF